MIQTLTWFAAIWAIGAIPAYYIARKAIPNIEDEPAIKIVGEQNAAIIVALFCSWVIVVMEIKDQVIDLTHRIKVWFIIRKTKRILRGIAKRPGMSDDIKQMIDKL